MANPENIAVFIKGLLRGCQKGDPRSLSLLWDRLEGSVKQNIDARLQAISPTEVEESALIGWLEQNEPTVLQRFRAQQITERLESDGGNGGGGEW